MTKLTKRPIDATRPSDHEQLCWDAELPGFGLRIKPSGAKSFLIQYRNKNGRSRRLSMFLAQFMATSNKVALQTLRQADESRAGYL